MPHTDVDLVGLKRDYEGPELLIEEIASKHEISKRTLYHHVARQGWRRRMPRRMDPHDLVNRFLQLIENQIVKLEFAMENPDSDESVVLAKLSATLDKLISVKADIAPKKARAPRPSKLMLEVREKLAERIAALNEG